MYRATIIPHNHEATEVGCGVLEARTDLLRWYSVYILLLKAAPFSLKKWILAGAGDEAWVGD